MAMQIKRTQGGSETWSRYGKCTAAEIKYLILSPTSKRAAIQGVIAVAPTAYGENNELPLKEFRFDGYVGDGDIEITAVYAEAEDSDGGDDSDDEQATMSFDMGSGTKHITHAIKQEQVYPGLMRFDDAGGGIGWNGKMGSEAEFAGVDVPTADMHEVYTKYIRTSRLTTAYKRVLCELYGKVNSKDFKGWKARRRCSAAHPTRPPLTAERKSLLRSISASSRTKPTRKLQGKISEAKRAGSTCGRARRRKTTPQRTSRKSSRRLSISPRSSNTPTSPASASNAERKLAMGNWPDVAPGESVQHSARRENEINAILKASDLFKDGRLPRGRRSL